MKNLFTYHPASVGENYLQHLKTALGFSVDLLLAALVCLVHALMPFLFVKTGSMKIDALYQRMVTHRDQRTGLATDGQTSRG